MLTHSTRRWLAGLGVAGALVAASATPAHAADPLEIFAWDTLVAPGHSTYNFIATYLAGETELTSATLDLDLSQVNDVATIEVLSSDWECVPAGETLHCEAEAGEWGVPTLDYYLNAKADAKPGQKAELGIKATGGGQAASRNVTVTIAEGVDLQSDLEAKTDGDPGATVGLPGDVVRNSGENTAHGAVLRLQTDYRSPYAGDFSNCADFQGRATVCTFDTDLEPGKSYRLSEKLPVTLDKGARTGSTLQNYVDWLTKDDWAQIADDADGMELTPRGKAAGAELKLVELPPARQAAVPQTDVDQSNNFTVIDIKVGGNNPADLAAVGSTANGKVGDTVTVTAGFTNLGPATVDAWRLTEPIVTVEIPKGTEAVKVAEECAPYDKDSEEPWNPWDHAGEPGADLYGCISAGDPEPGVGGKYPFTLRIDELTGPTSGTVTTHLDGDPKADNNVASVVVKPGNGGSGDGGNGGGDGDGGTLPITGESTALIAGVGGLLLAAGIGGYVVARRRRTRFVA